jgi:hypothetical protein
VALDLFMPAAGKNILIKHFKYEISLNVWKFISYFTRNKLRLHYEDQVINAALEK